MLVRVKKQEQASTINQQLKVDAIQLYEGIRERERRGKENDGPRYTCRHKEK